MNPELRSCKSNPNLGMRPRRTHSWLLHNVRVRSVVVRVTHEEPWPDEETQNSSELLCPRMGSGTDAAPKYLNSELLQTLIFVDRALDRWGTHCLKSLYKLYNP